MIIKYIQPTVLPLYCKSGSSYTSVFTVVLAGVTVGLNDVTPPTYYGRVRSFDNSGNKGPWTSLIGSVATLIDSAEITELTATKIKAGTITSSIIALDGANSIIKSANYAAGSGGWAIKGDGTAEFGSASIRGGLKAESVFINADNRWRRNSSDTAANSEFKVGSADKYLYYDGNATLTFTGNLSAAGGTFSGALSAATGTFSGALSAATGTFSGDLSAAGGTFSGNLSAVGGTFTGTLNGVDGTFTGLIDAGQITSGTITSRAINNGNGTFQVDEAGNLTCSSASITGVLNANFGSRVGNFYFNQYGLTNGSAPDLLGEMNLDTYNNIIYTPWLRVSDGGNRVDARIGRIEIERYGAGGTAPLYIARERNGANRNFCAFALAPYEGGAIGTISHNGTGAVSYNTTSDSRLKINLDKPYDALAVTNSLIPRVYKMLLATEAEKDEEHLGFFAQELYEVYPEAVNVGIDALEQDIDLIKMEPWGVDYSRITPLLTKAIQELSAKVAALESKMV
jgi:hypothetical protein